MARVSPDRPLQLSVLDRLIDRGDAGTIGKSSGVAQIKEAVKRDLEWLLNTKKAIPEQPDGLHHLNQSLLAYGLPDFTNASLGNPNDTQFLVLSVQNAVRRFEPRLTDVRVTLEPPRDFDRTIRFRIEGVLNVEPHPEVVSYDSVLQLHNRAFKVEAH